MAFARKSFKPDRQWLPLTGVVASATAITTQTKLYELQMPTVTIGTALTADPPEDVTILRLVAEYSFSFTQATQSGDWTIALTVQDANWTAGANFVADADKRMLWYQTFVSDPVASTQNWFPPDAFIAGTTRSASTWGHTRIDIAPKVRVEAGKALYAVLYENSGAQTATWSLNTCRLLLQHSGRR